MNKGFTREEIDHAYRVLTESGYFVRKIPETLCDTAEECCNTGCGECICCSCFVCIIGNE